MSNDRSGCVTAKHMLICQKVFNGLLVCLTYTFAVKLHMLQPLALCQAGVILNELHRQRKLACSADGQIMHHPLLCRLSS